MTAPLDVYRVTLAWQTLDGQWWAPQARNHDGPHGKAEAFNLVDRMTNTAVWAHGEINGAGPWKRRHLLVEEGQMWADSKSPRRWTVLLELDLEPTTPQAAQPALTSAAS